MRFIILIMIIFFSVTPVAFAANVTLEIIQPRGSGTGTPAIPSTHRIFYAYPGIEYKIRVAAIGGDYPYTYSLSNEPAGMTVDASGYIRWSNPQSNASNITIRVTDSESAYVETTWSITVGTSGFVFVDDVAGNGDGSLASPYNSISNMASAVSATDIVYFRDGTYSVPARGGHTIGGASAFDWDLPSPTATRWLAYPEESVTINLTNNRYFYDATSVPFYFEGLTFENGREYFFRSDSTLSYVTFLDNTFDTLTLERTAYNSNQGTYFTMHAGTGYFLTFQGNVFKGYRGAQGIGSLYDQNTTLIEGNHFSDFTGSDSTNQVLATKVGLSGLTLRGNVVNLSASDDFGIFGGATNGMFADGTPFGHGPKSENIEILYNYFRHDGSGGTEFNRYDDQGATWVYRNTFVCSHTMTYLSDADCDGPWYFNDNVFQNSDSGLTYHYTCSGNYETCVTESGTVGATSGVVDTSGELTASYSEYIGIAGWQFSDGSTPYDGSYTPPSSSTGSTTISGSGTGSMAIGTGSGSLGL